jgi:hypothetical protein
MNTGNALDERAIATFGVGLNEAPYLVASLGHAPEIHEESDRKRLSRLGEDSALGELGIWISRESERSCLVTASQLIKLPEILL